MVVIGCGYTTLFGTREVCVAQEQWMELTAWATLVMSCLTPVESLQDFPQLGHNDPMSSILKHALSGEGSKGKEEGLSSSLLKSTTVYQPQLNPVQEMPQSLKGDHSKNLLGL